MASFSHDVNTHSDILRFTMFSITFVRLEKPSSCAMSEFGIESLLQ